MSHFNTCDELKKSLHKLEMQHLSEIGPLQASLGETYYHYTSVDSLTSILLSGSIRLSSIKYCNDPKEIEYGVRFIQKFWADFGSNFISNDFGDFFTQSIQHLTDCINYSLCFKHDRELLQERVATNINLGGMQDLTYSNLKEQPFIFCLSEDGDDLRQWFPYSSGGAGVCLGFNIQKAKKNDFFDREMSFLKTTYKDYDLLFGVLGRYFDSLFSFFKFVRESEIQHKIKDSMLTKHFFDLVHRQLLSIILSLKNPSFEGEKEHRMLISNKETILNNEIKFSSNGDIVKPYIEVPFDKGCLVEVKLGPKCEKILNQESLEILLSLYEYKNAKVTVSNIQLR